MASPRPGSVTAAAVLSIVYGSLFTLCGLCGLVSLVAQGMGNNFMAGGPEQAQLQKQLQDAMERDVPLYQAVQIGGTLAGLGEALALLIAGIGLLNMRSWARTLALAASLVAIATGIFQAIYQAALVMPAMNNAFQVVIPPMMPPGPEAEGAMRFLRIFTNAMAIGVVVLYGLLVIYLSIIVVLLRRSHVRAAFVDQVRDDFEGRPRDEERRSSMYEDERDEDERKADEPDRDQPRRPDGPKDDWHVRE